MKYILCIFLFFVNFENAVASDFNKYILKAVDKLYAEKKGGGYDISKSFTHDIDYGGTGTVKASKPTLTMCVAAVAEIIIYATKIYADETGDHSVFTAIPLKAWTSGTPLSLRANVFMYAGTGSLGTGSTLKGFQLGEERLFKDLAPGDFINFNRTNNSGHAVVFTGFIRPNLSVSDDYSDDVVGFQYFSAQGKGKADAGFAFRNAFFGDFCPSGSTVPRDCKIIKSSSKALFNSGRMWHPDKWNYLKAVEQKKAKTRSAFEASNPGQTKGAIDALVNTELNKELSFDPSKEILFDGVTTD